MSKKLRYIVRTFVEAENPQKAIKIAKRTNPHEVYIDNEIWKMSDFLLEESKKNVGFGKK